MSNPLHRIARYEPALKARNIPAQGATLGMMVGEDKDPEAMNTINEYIKVEEFVPMD